MTWLYAAGLFALAILLAYLLRRLCGDAVLSAFLAMPLVLLLAGYIAVAVLQLRSGKLFALLELSILLTLVGVVLGVRFGASDK